MRSPPRPELLKLLEIQGCIVTIDAIGCQTEIAELIVEKEADHVPALIRTRWGAAHR